MFILNVKKEIQTEYLSKLYRYFKTIIGMEITSVKYDIYKAMVGGAIGVTGEAVL